MNKLTKAKTWLLPVILILLILEIAMVPFVINSTYATKNQNPEYIITYEKGKLTWDKNTVIDSDGTAKFSLFDTVYRNVKSDNSDKVVAPGTGNNNIIRLKNNARTAVKYKAVLYEVKSNGQLPIEVSLTGDNLSDTATYPILDSIKRENVLRAVAGNVGAGKIQDFDISWIWDFESNIDSDTADTYLGDLAANKKADDITVGLYIVVEGQDGQNISPSPSTGDSTMVEAYITLIIISAVLLVLLLIGRRKRTK